MLGETAMPRRESSSAMVTVVRRRPRNPVRGSPAVSCSSRSRRISIMSGVFFPAAVVPLRNGESGH